MRLCSSLRHRWALVEFSVNLLNYFSQSGLLWVPLHEARTLIAIGAWFNVLMGDTTHDSNNRSLSWELLVQGDFDIKRLG